MRTTLVSDPEPERYPIGAERMLANVVSQPGER
jgi:hypothetical protein